MRGVVLERAASSGVAAIGAPLDVTSAVSLALVLALGLVIGAVAVVLLGRIRGSSEASTSMSSTEAASPSTTRPSSPVRSSSTSSSPPTTGHRSRSTPTASSSHAGSPSTESGTESESKSENESPTVTTREPIPTDGATGREHEATTVSSTRRSTGNLVVDAASELRSRRTFSDPDARTLVETLADPNATRGDRYDALERCIEALETARVVEETVERAGDLRTESQVRAVDDRLRELDGSLPAALRPLSSELASERADRAETRSRESAMAEAMNDVCDLAESEPAVTLEGTDAVARSEDLARQLRTDTLSFRAGSTTASTVATTVRSRTEPDSPVARTLLDELERTHPEPLEATTLSEALTNVIETLEAYDSLRNLADDVDRDAVVERANGIKRDLDPNDPIQVCLLERVADRQRVLARTSASNTVFASLVSDELEFYDETLVPALADASRSEHAGEAVPRDLLRRVDRRIDAVDAYTETRVDHNHSIPHHFLSLARTLRDEAERAAGTDPEYARGTLEATEALVDHVDGLYERNQYSVMLRRLRG